MCKSTFSWIIKILNSEIMGYETAGNNHKTALRICTGKSTKFAWSEFIG